MSQTSGRFRNPYFKASAATKSFWQGDWWVYLGIVVCVSLLSWYAVAKLHWFWLNDIQVSGNAYLTQEEVKAAVNEALDKNHWFIVPQRFYLLTDKNKLASDTTTILQQQIGIKQLTAQTKFQHTVTVQIQERVPGYVYILSDHDYYLDDSGVVTSEVAANQLDPHFPHLRDRNKKRQIALNDKAVQSKVIDFISQLIDKFTTKTKLDISEFALLPISCQEKQYVAEKIFADEISGTKDDNFKQQKKDILKRLQNSEITVDQSLSLLEEIKQTENGGTNTNTSSNEGMLTWEAKYVDKPCEYAIVIQDIAVITQQGPEVYFDTELDVDQQLDHLALVLQNEKLDLDKIQYIDIRFDDRAYYK